MTNKKDFIGIGIIIFIWALIGFGGWQSMQDKRKRVYFRREMKKGDLTPDMVKKVSGKILWENMYDLYCYFLKLIKEADLKKMELCLAWIKNIRNRRKREAMDEALQTAMRKATPEALDKLYSKTYALGNGNQLTASLIDNYRKNDSINF